MTVIKVLNLKCGGCANTIKKGIITIEGVNEILVDLNTSEVRIDATDESVILQVKEKLASMGYPEVGDSNSMLHKAKSFVSCATGKMTSEEK
ncbi:MAG: heavy-metal-associated domain-containing protein [Lutibacter sp.]|nr:heavy-metal-associated domain-containing protein [Lutibacter sp.]